MCLSVTTYSNKKVKIVSCIIIKLSEWNNEVTEVKMCVIESNCQSLKATTTAATTSYEEFEQNSAQWIICLIQVKL